MILSTNTAGEHLEMMVEKKKSVRGVCHLTEMVIIKKQLFIRKKG